MSERAPSPVPELLTRFLRPVFLLRLTVAYVAAGALLMVSESALGSLIARGAQDLILLTSAVPYLDTLTWSGEWFRATTHLLGGHLSIEPQGYWFLIAFPAGFAAALPGLVSAKGAFRLLAAIGVSVAVASLLLAITADGLIAQKLHSVHIRVNPDWRDMLVRSAMGRFWDFAALMYPFAACLALAWSAVDHGEGSGRLLHWSTAAGLVALALLLMAADRYAEERRVGSEAELRPLLADLNPYFGRHLLLRAATLEASGHLVEAREACRDALKYPRFRRNARKCQRRITAKLRAEQGAR
jgi:hypothetical protein